MELERNSPNPDSISRYSGKKTEGGAYGIPVSQLCVINPKSAVAELLGGPEPAPTHSEVTVRSRVRS